jgi:hypothetical protein
MMQAGGKEKGFNAVLQNPPHTTRQIMQPDTYLSGEKIEPMHILDFKRDFKDYRKFDIGAMGEFDVAVLIEQYAGRPISKVMYPDWRGGYYYAGKIKSAATSSPPQTSGLALLYVSRWANKDSASQFAGIYAYSLKNRYKQLDEVEASAPKPGPNAKEAKAPHSLSGRHTWNTEEGPIVIDQEGETVFVTESVDPATNATLEKEVFPPATSSSAAQPK